MADIAIFPASQSILWQQAISMGLPLIVGERSAAATQLQDVSYLNGEDNIIVLQAQSPMVDELKYHIVRLAGDRSERQRMSAGARLVTERMLNWNTLIDRTLRFNSSCSASLDSEVPGVDPRPAIEALS
jgi:glycosyltransferase involved in cell wall biosynthesis